MKTVQDGHGQRRHPNEQDIWEDQAIQIDSFQLILILPEHGEEPDKEGRKNDPEYGQSGQNHGKCPKQTVCEFPGLFLGAIPHVIGEYWNEGSRHRAFPDEPPKEIRNAVGQHKGISQARGAQEKGQPLVTDISENPTDNRDDADNGSRFENLPFMGDGYGQKIEAPSLSLRLNL